MYSKEERYQKIAQDIESAINVLGLSEKEMATTMANYMHRTNQQAFTRLAIEWIKVVGADDYRYDGRNEASHKVCKELVDDLEDIYLPLI